MALMMSRKAQEDILEVFPDSDVVCKYIGAGSRCNVALGYMSVYRLGFAFTVFHFLLMLITCGVRSSRDCRAGLHNGMWLYKIMFLMVLCIACFFIPDRSKLFIHAWMYTSMAGAALYIVIQLLLLVFLFHRWTDKIEAKVKNGGKASCWYGVFALCGSITIYIIFILAIVALYYFFALDERCTWNRWLIIINAVACILVSIVALVKRGPKDWRLRLFHSSLVSLYVMFLTWTAIGSAPRKYQDPIYRGGWAGIGSNPYEIVDYKLPYYCGPNDDKESWTDNVLPYVSVVVMFITVVSASVSTASPENCEAVAFPSCPVNNDSPQKPRYDIEDIGGQRVVRNEKQDLAYSYPLFHVMLGLATLYMMMSLTGWYTPQGSSLLVFGRSWSTVWIKMASSWACLAIYSAVTLFPTMLPNRIRRANSEPIQFNPYADDESDISEACVPLKPVTRPMSMHQETTV